jgi:hypothetical protein
MEDSSSWSDTDDILYPGLSWKSLVLSDVEDIFHMRVLRTGTPQAPVLIPSDLADSL